MRAGAPRRGRSTQPRVERRHQAERHPGLNGRIRRTAFCNPPPTLLWQGGGRIAERGGFSSGTRNPRALLWAEMSCPFRAYA